MPTQDLLVAPILEKLAVNPSWPKFRTIHPNWVYRRPPGTHEADQDLGLNPNRQGPFLVTKNGPRN